MDSPKHCRMGNRAGSLFDSGHNYPGGIKKLYYYNERAEHIFVFCLYRAGAEGEYVAAATCQAALPGKPFDTRIIIEIGRASCRERVSA